MRADDRGAGQRLPNLPLRGPDGARARLHDVVGLRPTLLHVTDRGPAGAHAPVDRVITIGAHGYGEPNGWLRQFVGGEGWVLVRPDQHIAWARTGCDGLEGAISRALGR